MNTQKAYERAQGFELQALNHQEIEYNSQHDKSELVGIMTDHKRSDHKELQIEEETPTLLIGDTTG